MNPLLPGLLNAERDAEFSVWAEARRRRLMDAVRGRGLEALLIRCGGISDPSLAPLLPVSFSGRSGHRVAGGTLLVSASAWGFRPDSPWEVQEARALGLPTFDPRRVDSSPAALCSTALPSEVLGPDSGGRVGLVGFAEEETSPNPRQELETAALPADFVADRLRVPSPMEQRELDRVCAINDRAMRSVARLLVEAVADGGALWLSGRPLTVGRLRRAATKEVRSAGTSFPEGCLVSAGANAANPHDHGDDEHRIQVGEAIVVDLFPAGALFSDMTRTFVTGELGRGGISSHGSDLRSALADVEEALTVAENSVRRNLASSSASDSVEQKTVSANRVQRKVQEFFASRGWSVPEETEGSPPIDEGFVHGLGHGVGYRLHQAPWFATVDAGSDRGEIRAGEAFTLEPGLYRPGAWGVRIEDVYRTQCVEPSACDQPTDGAVELSGTPATSQQVTSLELVRCTRAPRTSDARRFLYEFARAD